MGYITLSLTLQPQDTHSYMRVLFHVCDVIGRGGTSRPGRGQRAAGNIHLLVSFHVSLTKTADGDSFFPLIVRVQEESEALEERR